MTASSEVSTSTEPDSAPTGATPAAPPRPGAAGSPSPDSGSPSVDSVSADPVQPAPAPAGPGTGTHWPRLAALALLVGLAGFAAWKLPLDKLPAWVDQLGPAAPVVAVLVCAVLLCALVPRTAISLGCGALFGAVAGAAWSLTAALLAATITYAAGRWAGRDFVAAHAGDRLARLDRWLARRGLLAVIVVRLQPIAPFGLVGYAYGTSSVRFRHYLLGTALGGLPSSFSYATIGAAAIAPHSLSWLTFIPAATGILISAAAALHWRHQTRHTGRPATA
ncbi:TVP38/TMEM64 family protein [Catellatospora vulcania]|uniref:TVP38/TMEM64 family protein n=1 Tax=Catellatospora vulcania TaxID=1460450 RepID=UPI001E44C6CB|nr:TVP38/TMEM64 family protein [Catellatospora vulcania]